MSLEQSRSLVPSSPFQDSLRPSQESQQHILRPAPAAQPSVEGVHGHVDHDLTQQNYEHYREEPLRNRHIARWPPSTDWDYNTRADRRYGAEQSSFDQGQFRREIEYNDDSYYLSSHHIDICCWILQDKAIPTRVVASAATGIATGEPFNCVANTEDTITLLVDWQSLQSPAHKGTAVYTASWTHPLRSGRDQTSRSRSASLAR